MTPHRTFRALLVTGGAGFIGTNFIRWLFDQRDFSGRIINLDKLTYAGNAANLDDVAARVGDRYQLVRGDIGDQETVRSVFRDHGVDAVVHFAAESHVDRSIVGPREFVTTNVLGTFALLEEARAAWRGRSDVLFHHVSTDEVYGSLGESGSFTENTPYAPRSPYSASKAGSDHLVRAYHHTYGLPVTVSNCSNNYGPFQFPEKIIPLMILNMLDRKPLPVYGEGKNIRDWLYVEDHARAIWTIMTGARTGETYTIGGDTELRNIDLVRRLCDVVAAEASCSSKELQALMRFVPDRLGHDLRYSIDCSRIKHDLGWRQSFSFEQGLQSTVRWYLSHPEWIQSVRSGEYRKWIEQNYRQMNRM